VSEEGQPRRPAITGIWSVMGGKDTLDHIFIDIDSKGLIDLLCDPWTTKSWVASF